MNLDLIRNKIETEGNLLSITKTCQTFFRQTHIKPQETLEFKHTKPKETFQFNPFLNLGLDSTWMVRFTSLEVYRSIFNYSRRK